MNSELKLIYDERESQSIVLLLLERLGFSNLAISLEPSADLSKDQLTFLDDKIRKLKSGKPVQYVLSNAHFYGLPFFVNENVLIPRPETEELTDMIIKDHCNGSPVIIDIGTGSGCIAVTLAKFIKNAKVFALDISGEAISVAMKNAREHGVQIEFIKDDILNSSYNRKDNLFDIIVTNPPYVLLEDVKEMMPNVLDHEPSQALFADISDPLLFYRKIFEFSKNHLRQKGYLYCEINEKLGRETGELAQGYGFVNVMIFRDINGKERMMKGRLGSVD